MGPEPSRRWRKNPRAGQSGDSPALGCPVGPDCQASHAKVDAENIKDQMPQRSLNASLAAPVPFIPDSNSFLLTPVS